MADKRCIVNKYNINRFVDFIILYTTEIEQKPTK